MTYLRRELNVRKIKVVSQLRFVNSKTNVLIQLADMITGAIFGFLLGRKWWDIVYVQKRH